MLTIGAGAAAWWWARRRARRVGATPPAEAAAALGALAVLLVVLWLVSPYALVIALPAAHAALVATSARRRWHVAVLVAIALAAGARARGDHGGAARLQPGLRALVPARDGADGSRGAPGVLLAALIGACLWSLAALVAFRASKGALSPTGTPPRRRRPPRIRVQIDRRRRRGGRRRTAGRIGRLAARLAFVSVVVPVYNERESVRPLCDELLGVLRGLGRRAEVLFVDDGSTDGTSEALADLAAREPEVIVVRLRRNFGKAAALMAGFREARGDAIVTIDGDLQDDPAEIPRLLAELEAGADLVSGWKRDRQDPAGKRAASRVFNGVTSRMSGVGLHDLNCGFKAYRSEVVRVARADRRPVPLHPGARGRGGLPGERDPGQPPARGCTGAASTASSATCAASSTC